MGALLEFICPKCGKGDIWAPAKSTVHCNNCYRWFKLKDVKIQNPCKIDDTDKYQQLKLF